MLRAVSEQYTVLPTVIKQHLFNVWKLDKNNSYN